MRSVSLKKESSLPYMNPSDNIIFEDIERAIDGLDLSQLKQSRILLLGASGLLGTYFSYLIYYLNTVKKFGIKADLYTMRPVGDDSRIAILRGVPGVRFFEHDASLYVKYQETYDFMIHAAGYGSPAFFLKDPIRTIDLNYIGMKSVLESALEKNPKARILYLSSSEIYGSPAEGNFPTPETYPGNSPVTSNRACYIESKRLAETLCLSYKSMHDMEVRIARPALSYGPGMTMEDGRVISQFIKKAYQEKEIRMVDDGKDLRCFCYLSDVLRELLYILLLSKDTIYNVGSAREEVSIFELATMIAERFGVKVIPGPGKDASVAHAPSRVQLDLKKLEGESGLRPRIGMKEGLQRTIDWNMALMKELASNKN
jgi:UDP-glucuronate decarboxylase